MNSIEIEKTLICTRPELLRFISGYVLRFLVDSSICSCVLCRCRVYICRTNILIPQSYVMTSPPFVCRPRHLTSQQQRSVSAKTGFECSISMEKYGWTKTIQLEIYYHMFSD